MRRLLTLLACLLVTSLAMADKVSEMEALKKAKAFMPGKRFELQKYASSSSEGGMAAEEPFYIFNVENGGGYVLVSANDQTTAILGYSTNGNIDLDNMPDNLRYWLDSYAAQLKAIDEGAPVAARAVADSKARTRSAHANIAPMLTTKWNQSEPYNLMCPDGNFKDYNANGYDSSNRCVTGCVATALAQVMYYHKWPQGQTTAIPQYTINYSNAPTLSPNELPATTFEWNLMKSSYSEAEDDDAAYAVAKLMRYVGQACQMAYGTGASSAHIHTDMMISAFGYSKSIHTKDRDGYTTTQWENMVYDELASGRPVLYSGNTDQSDGHQFVCDGYKDGLFSLNWGWGGDLNGYFVLSIAEPDGVQGIGGSIGAFRLGQDAVFNFMPVTSNEEEIPMLASIIGTNTASANYTRASASDDFTGISISCNYRAKYSYQPTSIYSAEIGWGLYQGEQLIKCVGSFTKNINYLTVPAGSYYTGWMNTLSDASFGAGLSDGTYQLRQIFRKADSNDAWELMDNYGSDFLVAEISGNTLTVRARNTSTEVFSVNSISVPDGIVKGESASVTVNITNEGETNQQTVRLWLQQEGSSNWTLVASETGYVGPDAPGDVVLSFTPTAAGSYTLKVTNNSSDEPLGTTTLTVHDVIQVTSDEGIVYSCVPALGTATITSGGEDTSKSTLNIPATITAEGKECIVKAIADRAFYNWNNLSSIEIPEGIENVGDRAFMYCFSLRRIILPSTLKSIGEKAFYRAEDLSEVISHIQVPFAIDENTFKEYDFDLETTIPSRATLYVPFGTKGAYQEYAGWTMFKAIEEGEIKEAQVGDLKYSYSTGSKKATVIAGDFKELTSIDIPAKVTIDNVEYPVKAIGDRAFYGCGNLSSVSLPVGLKTIGNRAFYNCYCLEAITLPRGLETIADAAFASCFWLEAIELPSSLTNIGEKAFNKVPLTNVTSHILEPSDISDETFTDIDFNTWKSIPSEATLYVPKGTKSKYENCAGWSTIFQGNIEETDFADGDANGDGSENMTDAVDAISYLLGQTPDNFDAAAVDMNGDGLVTVTDIILLLIAYSLIP